MLYCKALFVALLATAHAAPHVPLTAEDFFAPYADAVAAVAPTHADPKGHAAAPKGHAADPKHHAAAPNHHAATQKGRAAAPVLAAAPKSHHPAAPKAHAAAPKAHAAAPKPHAAAPVLSAAPKTGRHHAAAPNATRHAVPRRHPFSHDAVTSSSWSVLNDHPEMCATKKNPHAVTDFRKYCNHDGSGCWPAMYLLGVQKAATTSIADAMMQCGAVAFGMPNEDTGALPAGGCNTLNAPCKEPLHMPLTTAEGKLTRNAHKSFASLYDQRRCHVLTDRALNQPKSLASALSVPACERGHFLEATPLGIGDTPSVRDGAARTRTTMLAAHGVHSCARCRTPTPRRVAGVRRTGARSARCHPAAAP